MRESLENILLSLRTYVDAVSTFSERSDEPLNYDECVSYILHRVNDAIDARRNDQV